MRALSDERETASGGSWVGEASPQERYGVIEKSNDKQPGHVEEQEFGVLPTTE